jgi:hypothetical protein
VDPVAWLGVSPDELNEQVAGAVWARWVEAEPDLAAFTGLEAVHALRGSDNDPPFGALLRLAAQTVETTYLPRSRSRTSWSTAPGT